MKKFIKILFFIFFVFIIPLIINLAFFPLKTVDLEKDLNIAAEQIEFDNKKISSYFKTGLIKLFRIPSGLELYNINIETTNKPEGCSKEKGDVLMLVFIEGNPEKYFKPSLKRPNENDMFTLPNESYWNIYFDKKGTFAVAPKDKIIIAPVIIWGCAGDIEPEFSVDYRIYATQNIRMWLIKLLFIFIFWNIILSSLITVFRFFIKRINKN